MNYSGLDIGTVSDKVRRTLLSRNYVETVSPIIRRCASGVNNRFGVIDNKGSRTGYLRDCMETPLRMFSRVAPKVFEIGPCFRPEKEDDTHKQEFYLMELYSVGEGLPEMRNLTETIVSAIMDMTVPSKTISIEALVFDEFKVKTGETPTEELAGLIRGKYGYAADLQPYQVVNAYIEKASDPLFAEPGVLFFLVDYPVCTIDTAARVNGTNTIHRFEAFFSGLEFKGLEIANAFVDCLDAEDMAARDNSASASDDEGKNLMELTRRNCLPPTVGLGIGIDRLCMIRERRTK